jgi:hypothetical protein
MASRNASNFSSVACRPACPESTRTRTRCVGRPVRSVRSATRGWPAAVGAPSIPRTARSLRPRGRTHCEVLQTSGPLRQTTRRRQGPPPVPRSSCVSLARGDCLWRGRQGLTGGLSSESRTSTRPDLRMNISVGATSPRLITSSPALAVRCCRRAATPAPRSDQGSQPCARRPCRNKGELPGVGHGPARRG